MTGGEIVPIAGAAKKALSGDGSDKKLLGELAKEHPAAKQAAASYAKRLAIKEGLLLKIYSPLSKLAGISQDYYEKDFAADMAGKIDHIPQEHLTSPKPSVAVPAMQALGYSLDEPALKEMYLNLLATATDDRKSDDAHPSFAEIIRQLTADEAESLPHFLTVGNLAIVNITLDLPEGRNGYRILAQNVLNLVLDGAKTENPDMPVWIDNWIRLGLVTVDYQTHLTAPNVYGWVDERPEMIRFRSDPDTPSESVKFTEGVFSPTSFGAKFAKAVFPE